MENKKDSLVLWKNIEEKYPELSEFFDDLIKIYAYEHIIYETKNAENPYDIYFSCQMKIHLIKTEIAVALQDQSYKMTKIHKMIKDFVHGGQ